MYIYIYIYTHENIHKIYMWRFPKIVGFPPKSSILIGFSIINHPFWGPTPIFGNTHIYICISICIYTPPVLQSLRLGFTNLPFLSKSFLRGFLNGTSCPLGRLRVGSNPPHLVTGDKWRFMSIGIPCTKNSTIILVVTVTGGVVARYGEKTREAVYDQLQHVKSFSNIEGYILVNHDISPNIQFPEKIFIWEGLT